MKRIKWCAIDREGVVKMGYGSEVPRVTSHRARDESVDIIDEVKYDDLQEFLRKTCDWGRVWGGCLFDALAEELCDFGLASVPHLVR